VNTEERQLSEMLRRVTPEPPRRVTVEDVAFHLASSGAPGRGRREPRARRASRGRGWAPVLAAASVFVVAGASAGIAVGLTSHGTKAPAGSNVNPAQSSTSVSTSSASPSQTQTSVGPAAHGRSVAGGLWGAELIDQQKQGHTFVQNSLVGGANSLYAISPQSLERINPANGVVEETVPFTAPIANPPVVSGNTVWLVSAYGGSNIVLRGYDGQTLAQVAVITVPVNGQVSPTANGVLTSGSGGDLYLAAGDSVMVINPATRRVIKQIEVSAGPVTSVAVTPDGGRLYASTSGTGTFKLLTYSLATGAQTGSSTLNIGSSASANLVATAGGVWGTTGVGMSEIVWFAPAANLNETIQVSQGTGGGLDSIPVLADGTVWIGGSHTLECANPDTGRIEASAQIPADDSVVEYFSGVTMAAGHAYAYYTDQRVPLAGVVTLTPPSACSA
jgi:YVTN family beta-propeller protein